MKFFVDTANLEQIKKIQGWFHLDGVTTNPTLVAQSGKTHHSLIHSICQSVPGGLISAEVISTSAEEMYREALELANIHPQVVVKIPLIKEGLIAVKKCAKKNISTNVTLCFSALQALMAARAGANMVSIFVGRLDDTGVNGMEVVENVVHIFSQYQIQTKILVASIRHVRHVLSATQVGADMVTIPPPLFDQMIQHPLTDKGLNQFLKSAAQFTQKK